MDPCSPERRNTPHGVLIVDKPCGPTSHDLVRLVRRAYRTRAVGHAGTLDPMATGVLVIGIGEATKLLHYLSGVDKTYLATVTLGAGTDSLDAQGRVVAQSPLPADLSLATVARVASGFVGEHMQRVPDISAVKQQGQRLYALARRGQAVVAPERRVVLHALDVLRVEGAQIDLRVHCSKGFYVRALARDLAAALGTLGHISRLRRTASGRFSLADAVDCAHLNVEPPSAPPALLSPAVALRGEPCLTLSAQGVIEVGHGRPVLREHVRESELPSSGAEPVGLIDEQGVLRALGRSEGERIVVVRGVLAPASV
jgi:tRNA pseudouridine55 synthase